MEGKKSFIAYCDWSEIFNELSDEQAGKLIKHVFEYVNDKNPETDDLIIKLAFVPIKQALKRDLKQWNQYIDKQRNNGLKGGRPKKPKKTQKSQGLISKPKKADNVSVNVNDSVNVNVNDTDNNIPVDIDANINQINDFRIKVYELGILDFIENDKFIHYWTEKSENGKKCRWQKEKVFDIKKRLERWKMNIEKSGNYAQTDQEQHKRIDDELKNLTFLKPDNPGTI